MSSSIISFLLFYSFIVLFIVPLIAKPFGRVALPFESQNLKASNFVSVLFCRNYVEPNTKKVLLSIAKELNKESHQKIEIVFLDACFPFINGFPLLPHLSHSDGKKIDLAFLYKDKQSGIYQSGSVPNYIGYGMFEKARSDEKNTATICSKKGNPLYSMTKYFTYRWDDDLIVDEILMRKLFYTLDKDYRVKKMFIEPHLVERWKLDSRKIRFHGCHAVRHDDHIHVEME